MKEKRINKYYKTCYPSNIEIARHFKNEKGIKNENYIFDLLTEYERQQEAEIRELRELESDVSERLVQENRLICMFFSDVFKLYDAVCDYKRTSNTNIINRINRCELEIEQRFSYLNYHNAFIIHLVNKNRFNEAIVVKRFIEQNFENLVNHFNSLLGVNLKESPLKKKVLSYQKQLKDSIDYQELKLLSSTNKNLNSQNSNSTILEDEVFSVKDWCFVFYYVECNLKGNKKEKVEKFIEERKIKNQYKEIVSSQSFLNKYYEVRKELKGEDSTTRVQPQEIIKKIEKILPLLKVNSKPYKTANKDINYFKGELE